MMSRNGRSTRIAAGLPFFLAVVSGYAADTTFHPDGCEFAVTFPKAPTIEQYEVPVDDKACIGHVAWYMGDKGQSGLKAECVVCPVSLPSPIAKDDAMAVVREHAMQSGVEDAVFQFDDSGVVPTANYRGVIRNLGNTFVATWHFGTKSGLTLVGSVPYVDYGTFGFEKFVSSVKYFSNLSNQISSPNTSLAPPLTDARESTAERQRVVQAAIANTLCLASWQQHDPTAWSLALEHDTRLKDKPEWVGRSLSERFALVESLVVAERPTSLCYIEVDVDPER